MSAPLEMRRARRRDRLFARLGYPLWTGVLAAAVAGCGPGGAAAGDAGETYLAFASSFAGYRGWEAFPVPEGSGDGTVHTLGARTEHLNKRPAEGATEFGVGTIIVKETTSEALADRKVFAMVKRGGDYNAQGAAGWEWFELQNLDEQAVRIVWRGVGPPAGEMYGGDPKAGCNGCHVGAADNDFVLSTAITLEAL